MQGSVRLIEDPTLSYSFILSEAEKWHMKEPIWTEIPDLKSFVSRIEKLPLVRTSYENIFMVSRDFYPEEFKPYMHLMLNFSHKWHPGDTKHSYSNRAYESFGKNLYWVSYREVYGGGARADIVDFYSPEGFNPNTTIRIKKRIMCYVTPINRMKYDYLKGKTYLEIKEIMKDPVYNMHIARYEYVENTVPQIPLAITCTNNTTSSIPLATVVNEDENDMDEGESMQS